MPNSIKHDGANDREDFGPGAVLNLSGTPPGPGSGRITANNTDLIPPPIGTPDGKVLTAKATAPGGMDWEPEGALILAGLTDVLITNPQNGDFLKYQSSSGKWINSAT